MRAIVCSAPDPGFENTRFVEIAVPVPARGQVRVTMRAASLNPVDWKLASGVSPWWVDTGPHVVGLDGAGVIDAIGEGVCGWKLGDWVMWHGDLNRQGVLASHALADAHVLSKIPNGVGFREAAALPCAGMTAYQALMRKARIEAGQTVLVQGAGGAVGGFAVQIARHVGAQVIALAREEQRERVFALGADVVLDRRLPDLRDRVRALTGGYGADVMVEVANPGDARLSLDLIRYNGHLLCIDPLAVTDKVQPYTYAVSIHEVALGGAYGAGHRPTQEDFAVMGGELLLLLRDGKLDPMIERIVPFEAALGELKAMPGKASNGKLVVEIAREEG